MTRCYPGTPIGCQFKEIADLFGTKPFVYSDVHALVPGPATLKKMENNGWLKSTGRVKVGRYRYKEYRVVPPMKQWADEQEEEEQKTNLQAGETPDGDDL